MSTYPTRQNEILKLIGRYGVLDSYTLLELLQPRPKLKSLQVTLKRLEKSGLLGSGTPKLRGRSTKYWIFNKSDSALERILARTGLDPSVLRNKSTHWSQYPHEALCSLVQAAVERQMPSLWVLREATGNFKDLPEHLLSERVRKNGYMPDLCIGIPLEKANASYSGAKAYRWIAVEVDRSFRSHKRIAARANIYSRHTAFAGLLYFMPHEGNRETLTHIYANRGAKKSLRISGGSETFLATAVMPEKLFDVNNLSVHCGETTLSLCTWLALFALSEVRQRDSNLQSLVRNDLSLKAK